MAVLGIKIIDLDKNQGGVIPSEPYTHDQLVPWVVLCQKKFYQLVQIVLTGMKGVVPRWLFFWPVSKIVLTGMKRVVPSNFSF